jgi:hypothetical protein
MDWGVLGIWLRQFKAKKSGDATEGGVRAEVVIVVRAPVFDEESGFGQGAKVTPER